MNDLDPVTAFRNLTPDQVLDAVETSAVRCDGTFLALNSYENRVYRVGVEDGEPVVAKFYRPRRWSDECILEEHRFCLELAASEIPVVPPLTDANGETLFRQGPFRFSLYPCRGGRPLELDNPEHLEQIGRFIGRIHALGAAGHFQHRPRVDVESYLVRASEFLLGNDFLPPHLVEAYRSLVDDLRIRIDHCFQRAGEVRQIRLHGDMHLGNVLWTDDGPHIVDLDDARTGPAMQDIWMLLSGDRDYMSAGLEDVLEGYSQFYEFNPAELHLLEALRTLRIIHQAGWIASRWEDPAFPRAFPWFNSNRYWEDHVLSLREQAALMDEPPLEWQRDFNC